MRGFVNVVFSLLSFYVFLFKSCNSNIDFNNHLINDKLKISYHINNYKNNKINYKTHSFLYGTISIKNISNRIVKINLSDYELVIGDSKKAKPYINSIASILIQETPLKPNEVIKKNVYWAFKGKISQQELDIIKIYIKKNKCFIEN